MSQFVVLTCPYCRAKKMTFDVAPSTFVCKNFTNFFCQCRNCLEVVIVAGEVTGEIGASSGNICDCGIEVYLVVPQPSEPLAPPDTPNDVAKPFIDGLTALSVGLIASAGNSFRTTLERATFHLLKKLETVPDEHANKRLYGRIKFLRDHSLITPSLYEWAHIIRDLGNMGTHGDVEFSKDQAVELKNFTEQFLTYVFTMPARVEKVRRTDIES